MLPPGPGGPTPPRLRYRSTARDVGSLFRTVGLHVMLTAMCFTMVLPFIWMTLTSLKPQGQVADPNWIPEVDPHLRPGHVRDPDRWVRTLQERQTAPAAFLYDNLSAEALRQVRILPEIETIDDRIHVFDRLARDITHLIRREDFIAEEAFADVQPGRRAAEAYERADAVRERIAGFDERLFEPFTRLLAEVWPDALPPDYMPTPADGNGDGDDGPFPANPDAAADDIAAADDEAAEDPDELSDEQVRRLIEAMGSLAAEPELEPLALTPPTDDLTRAELVERAKRYHTSLRRHRGGLEAELSRERGLGNRYMLAAAFPELIIEPPRLQWFNYLEVLQEIPFLRYYWNSIFVATFVTFLTVLTSSMAAFSFARLQWPGRDKVFLLYLATMMVPGLVMMIPNYWIMIGLGLVDTLGGLIVPAAFSAFGTFLLRQFMLTIPSSLDEAAEIDGAGKWRLFWDVILPLARPGIVTLAIFTFIGNFHSFFWPLVMIRSQERYTLPIGLLYFSERPEDATHLLMAGVTMSVIPLIIVFILLQKTLVRGIQLGAVKG